MAWVTPKTDWATDDAVGTTDLNRIEGNIDHIGKGAIDGGGLTSASSLDVGTTGVFFILSGATSINYISTVGKAVGSFIFLKMPSGSAPTIKYKTGSVPANYAAIVTATGADVAHYIDEIVMLIYDGTYWNEVGRFNT